MRVYRCEFTDDIAIGPHGIEAAVLKRCATTRARKIWCMLVKSRPTQCFTTLCMSRADVQGCTPNTKLQQGSWHCLVCLPRKLAHCLYSTVLLKLQSACSAGHPPVPVCTGLVPKPTCPPKLPLFWTGDCRCSTAHSCTSKYMWPAQDLASVARTSCKNALLLHCLCFCNAE